MKLILLLLLFITSSCARLDCGLVLHKTYEPAHWYTQYNPALKMIEQSRRPERFGIILRGVYQGDTIVESVNIDVGRWARLEEGDSVCLK